MKCACSHLELPLSARIVNRWVCEFHFQEAVKLGLLAGYAETIQRRVKEVETENAFESKTEGTTLSEKPKAEDPQKREP